MNKYLILAQMVIAENNQHMSGPNLNYQVFGGSTTDDALVYLKAVTGSAINDLLTYDCTLKSQPRHNLSQKWRRMVDFNFRNNREWKTRTENEEKTVKHCGSVNPNPMLGDDINHVMLTFHHEHLSPLQQLELIGGLYVKIIKLKYGCYPTVADRRLRKFSSMMNSILRPDRVSGDYCP